MNNKDIAIEIGAMLREAEAPLRYGRSEECCIYRVPSHIRSVNKDAYTPKLVSIGPFHHGRPRLQNMERDKLIFCNAFLQRSRASLEIFLCYIQEIEPRCRRCYSDTLKLTEKELVKIILVDSCFLFELFLKYYYNEWSWDDMLFSKPWEVSGIMLDLFLLENQLPFFVLDNLFNRSASVSSKIPSFLDLAFVFFAHFNRSKLNASDNITIRHFTDLIRTFHIHPPEKRPLRTIEPVAQPPSTTELLEAGVRLKVNTKSNCLLDLRFSKGVLQIPRLRVEDETETLFRNMMILERCHYPDEGYITDYIAVWDFLIKTSRDVDILVRNKILVNFLSDGYSVINMFDGLWKNITRFSFNSNHLQLCRDLNDYCEDSRYTLMATLMRDYCSTPWHTVASVAGIVLVVLTLLQSVCSVIQVIQGSHK